MIRICCVVLVGFLMAACSPDYNWRQVSVEDGLVVAFFPQKVVTQSRPLPFDNQTLNFSLTSAAVGNASFTLGHTALTPELQKDPQAARRFAHAVMESLYRNLGVEPPASFAAYGQPFVIDGRSPKGPLRMKAVVWLTPKALIEALVVAGPDDFPDAQASEFVAGVKVSS